ncbi:MAG: YceI family protein [Bacteroidota bacterium]
MKKSLSFLTMALLIVAVSACGDGVGDAPQATTGDAVAADAAATGVSYTIDTEASALNWRGAKVTDAHDGGFNAFSGTIMVDGETVTGVEIEVDMTSMWSDNERLTGHLMSEDFFEVETYPKGLFALTSITPGDSLHTAMGNLTMLDSTRGISFPVDVAVVDENTVTASADFIIDRQEWGISYPGRPDDLISDDVRIMFDVTARK